MLCSLCSAETPRWGGSLAPAPLFMHPGQDHTVLEEGAMICNPLPRGSLVRVYPISQALYCNLMKASYTPAVTLIELLWLTCPQIPEGLLSGVTTMSCGIPRTELGSTVEMVGKPNQLSELPEMRAARIGGGGEGRGEFRRQWAPDSADDPEEARSPAGTDFGETYVLGPVIPRHWQADTDLLSVPWFQLYPIWVSHNLLIPTFLF